MINAALVTKFFLAMLFLKALIQSYLDVRNRRHIALNSGEVPEQFKEKIGLEDHQKAARYSIEKIKVGQFFRTANLFILLAWTILGGLQLLDEWVAQYFTNTYYKAIAFISIFSVINLLLGLPQSLYSTFVIEEKYGFNKMTAKLFIIDMIKGLVLGALLGLPLFMLLIYFIENVSMWWFWAWASVTSFQFLLIFIYPRFIAPLFNKFSPLEEGETKNEIEKLLDATGFESNGLFVMDASKRSSHGNAYFTGFGKEKRIVFFDNLLKTTTPSQIKAVLAHELGHFKRKHIIKGMVKSIFLSLLGFWILGYLYDKVLFYQGHGLNRIEPYLTLILFSMVSPVYTFFMTPISSHFSRKYEFEADEFASQYSDPQDLVDALLSLYKENASTLTPDPMYSKFYYSHPPALERIEQLLKFKKETPPQGAGA